MAVSDRVTVKSNFLSLSAGSGLVTLLETTRPPSTLLLVKTAVALVAETDPVSPVLVVVQPSSVSSSTS